MYFSNENRALVGRLKGETLRIEAWGKNALRIRSSRYPEFTGNDWALTEELTESDRQAEITINGEESAVITNGRLSVNVSSGGVLSIYRDGKLILREHNRNYGDCISEESRCLKVVNREYKGIHGGDFKTTLRFEGNDGEKIYGMGQYQYQYMDLKGCVLELEQKNSQIVVPFLISNLGYGMLWNNPGTGKVTFGKNLTEWVMSATKELDYWITADENPSDILKNYTAVSGRAPMMPECYMGLWQCKLRYRTQDEVLEVAREYQKRGIHIDVIVIDFFHWTLQGDWKFDTKYWPDPKAMVDELHSYGIKVMVSVWPSVDKKSENFYEMNNLGYLIRTERGSDETYDYQGDCLQIDVTNPKAREYVWNKCKKNYYDYGIDCFWLDNSEPDMVAYDFDNYRYYMGPAEEVSSIYPQLYAKAFNDGISAEGKADEMLHLVRSAWAGNAKYSALIWSGDVPSNFTSFRDQIIGGQNMGLAGIPWWTTDVGGFMTDDCFTDEFKELLLRWYEFAAFTPILRMHGDRGPYNIPPLDDRDWGGGYLHTGQKNELWSYGDDAYKIMYDILQIRQELKPYISSIYKDAHETGAPLIRAMFFEFPEDDICWELPYQFMFGPDYLVAPVTVYGAREVDVYLPFGKWKNIFTNEVFEGGQTITAAAPIEYSPVFKKL